MVKRWKSLTLRGLPKEKEDTLLKKYEMPKKFVPPALNLEVKKLLMGNQRVKDDSYVEVQRIASFDLASLGAAINMLK